MEALQWHWLCFEQEEHPFPVTGQERKNVSETTASIFERVQRFQAVNTLKCALLPFIYGTVTEEVWQGI